MGRPPAGVYCRLADVFFSQHRAPEAEQVMKQCLAKWPQSAAAHDMLAGIYLQTGRAPLARQHIGEALRLAPGNAIYQAHSRAIMGNDGSSSAPVSSKKE